MEKYSSGRRGVTRNLVGRESVAWVQIPPSPPKNDRFEPVVFYSHRKAKEASRQRKFRDHAADLLHVGGIRELKFHPAHTGKIDLQFGIKIE